MLDLEGRHPGRLDVLRLQPGDQPLGVVAQSPQAVEFGVVSGGDKAAVAGKARRFVDQRRAQIGKQRVGLTEIGEAFIEQGGKQALTEGRNQPVRHRLRPVQSGQHGLNIARATATQRQPGQRPLHIRHLPQSTAQILPQAAVLHECRDCRKAVLDRAEVGEGLGQPLAQPPRPCGRHRAVDEGKEAALGLPALGREQLQIPARGWVDIEAVVGLALL
ncbi:MAG: Uncharacterised protein [Rhodospirillaceae bacterium]|nr:MAG: Uncharacterised protein [Rhodospirillaceae bacterium]